MTFRRSNISSVQSFLDEGLKPHNHADRFGKSSPDSLGSFKIKLGTKHSKVVFLGELVAA